MVRDTNCIIETIWGGNIQLAENQILRDNPVADMHLIYKPLLMYDDVSTRTRGCDPAGKDRDQSTTKSSGARWRASNLDQRDSNLYVNLSSPFFLLELSSRDIEVPHPDERVRGFLQRQLRAMPHTLLAQEKGPQRTT